MQHNGLEYVGIGIYTLAEAARLTGVSPQRIRRWLLGYRYKNEHGIHTQPALFAGQIAAFDRKVELGFRDLIEVRIVNALVQAGLGLPTIRRAMDRARDMIGTDHPFSTVWFRTDGRAVFLELPNIEGEPVVVDILRNQYTLRRIVEPSFKNLEFAGDHVARWWPLTPRRTVVIDPLRSFGQPVAAGSGVPTLALAQAARIEESSRKVAAIFRVSPQEVNDAVEFEKSLAA